MRAPARATRTRRAIINPASDSNNRKRIRACRCSWPDQSLLEIRGLGGRRTNAFDQPGGYAANTLATSSTSTSGARRLARVAMRQITYLNHLKHLYCRWLCGEELPLPSSTTSTSRAPSQNHPSLLLARHLTPTLHFHTQTACAITRNALNNTSKSQHRFKSTRKALGSRTPFDQDALKKERTQKPSKITQEQ